MSVVERLKQETVGVTVYPGHTPRTDHAETLRHVELEHDGRTERLEFTSAVWVADSAHRLREKYDAVFFECLPVRADEWREIRTYWGDRQTVEYDTAPPTRPPSLGERGGA